MGGYIGATAVGLVTTAADVQGDITSTDTTPEVILKNTTETDADGSRDGKITFKGEQSGGEESTLAQIQSSHDGTSDDQKGDLIFKTNDGSDGASPTEAMRIDSGQNVGIGIIPTKKLSVFGTGSGNATVLIEGEGGADPYINFLANNTQHWSMGIDDSDSDSFKISEHSALGTNDYIVVNTSGKTTFKEQVDITTGTDKKLSFRDADDTFRAGIQAVSSSGQMVSGSVANDFGIRSQSNMLFAAGGNTEAMRIDTSGNVLVGHTSAFSPITDGGSGVSAMANGQLFAGMAGIPLYVNREDSDGGVAIFRKDGARVGKIFVGGRCSFISDNGASGGGLMPTSIDIRPTDRDGNLADNVYDLGAATVARFDDIYATGGILSTSDEREKQDIASLTSAEITAATAISKLFKTFKWKDRVTEKGDNARTHSGVIAQQVQTAMSDAGLDAGDYAFFINTVWWETRTDIPAVEADPEKGIEAENAWIDIQDYLTEEEAPEGAVKKTRMGIRYTELLSFIGAATEQRLTSIESRLTALEG